MAGMPTFRDLRCLVTGASAGIGREIARALAREGARLALTARRADRLEALAAEARDAGAPEVHVLAFDLAEADAPDLLADAAEAALGGVDLLVNNAGFAVPGSFQRSDPERTRAMLRVNVEAPTRLMRRLLPPMAARGHGAVLNVSSLAAFQPAPFQAAYAGTKAYLLNLSESVHQEALRDGVLVTALCPGVTDTEFFDAAGYRRLGRFMEHRMPADRVARIALAALRKGRMTVVCGVKNRVLLFIERFAPRTFVAAVSRRLMAGR
jgi:uncharacterized protein